MTTQQRTALDKANQYRMVQANLKRSLRGEDMEEGKRVALGVIREPAPEMAAMRVFDLLRAIHAVGPYKATAICRRCKVSGSRRVGELTENERTRLDIVLTI